MGSCIFLVTESLLNYARQDNGATCTTNCGSNCVYAIDNAFVVGTYAELCPCIVNNWVTITFAQEIEVTTMRIMQRFNSIEQIENIQIEFQDGSSIVVSVILSYTYSLFYVVFVHQLCLCHKKNYTDH